MVLVHGVGAYPTTTSFPRRRESILRAIGVQKLFFVYILASGKNGTLYIGVTSDLVGRTYTHRNDLIDGFSRRYGVHDLVWFEQHPTAETAIAREKQLKKWNRAWKVRLVEETNPHWLDRYEELTKHWG